jgi:hypothetical protein
MIGASPSQIATGTWHAFWDISASGNTGTLQVKAYFNSVLVSDKNASASSFAYLTGDIEVSIS